MNLTGTKTLCGKPEEKWMIGSVAFMYVDLSIKWTSGHWYWIPLVSCARARTQAVIQWFLACKKNFVP